MLTRSQQIENVDELRQYVSMIICEHHDLAPEAFPMTERILLRGGQPCGITFCIHGPRATKYMAIWDAHKNQILFYGCDGERFQKTELLGTPEREHIAA